MKNKLRYIYIFLVLLLTSITTIGQSRVLEVPFITQQPFGNLCWAASTAMVSTYYGNNTSTCNIVEWARLNLSYPNRGTSNCCGTPMPSPCDRGLIITDIPVVLASENLSSTEDGVITLSNLANIINNNRPMIFQGYKSSGSWHTMVIIGYSNSDIHYIDPWDGYYINSYSDATTLECLGAFYYKWEDYTHILTTPACPSNLFLHNAIGANATIRATVGITCEGIINNNSTVSLIAGNNILFTSGFEVQLGSTLEASVSSNPCQ